MSSNGRLPAKRSKGDDVIASGSQDYVTMTIAEQLFGIPVLQVQDVLGHQKITRTPARPRRRWRAR